MQHLPIVAPINGSRLGGSKRERAIQWTKLLTLGASKGVPDLLICTAPPLRPGEQGPWFPGVAVEMKRPDGKGQVTPEQHAWHERLRGFGWKVVVAHGFDEARRQLEELGYGRPAA